MTQTSNPQFAIARSVICSTSGAICLVILFILVAYVLRYDSQFSFFSSVKFIVADLLSEPIESNYKWSVKFIVAAQMTAILFGSISPICRWFTVTWFKFTGGPKSSFRDLWTVEEYWTERLRELKESQSRLNCRLLKLQKWNWRALFLDICIMFQIFTVISCKFLSFISLAYFLPFQIILVLIKLQELCFWIKKKETVDTRKKWDPEWELNLEKETEFPKHTIKKIVSAANGYIKKGKKKADSMKLIKLLNKADGFDGIEKFNPILIQRLTGIAIGGVPNNRNGSWTMMVVTLSTIAVACPNTTWDCDEFVLMVSNVLPYVIYVDEIVGVGSKVENIIDLVDAAMVVWFDVRFSRRWLKNTNLPIQTTENNSLKEKLTILQESSTKYVKNATTGIDKLRITAAEWMNETVEIVLQFSERGHEVDDLSEKISGMVADILAACLVNLSKAITIKISDTPIEKREDVVKEAASIFGETEQVRQFAEKRLSSAAKDHKDYVEASWWKVVINKPLIEDTIKDLKASHVSTYEHKINIHDHTDDA
ncbi:uncharacterized protein LOC124909846 [Impatiens glandulifera]|uniref:uncharacterized protein LOC124909846 n=1 Tax=Impatiens glandulifera TaxID=253017 RepID=UPI001FB12CC2|nr:uncharacterized protein LOC124909846 [Impatiens glandulifera]